jgi:hypothetical protein
MLSLLRTVMCVISASVLVCLVAGAPAMADGATGGVTCIDPSNPKCVVDAATTAKTGRKGGGPAGDGTCHSTSGAVIACQRDGGWAGVDGCYYKPTDLSADTVAALGGQPGGAGAWYERTCYGTDGTAITGFDGPVWLNAPPAPAPEVVAQQARSPRPATGQHTTPGMLATLNRRSRLG